REVLDVVHVGRNLGENAAPLGDQEAMSGVGLCRMEHHRDRCAAVHTNSGKLDLTANSRLSRPDKSLRHCPTSLDPRRRNARPVSEHPEPPDHPVSQVTRRVVVWAGTQPKRATPCGCMNQTILCRSDWGQITLSYALLPFRPSSATVSPSLFLISPKKN